jgi:glucokinase
VSEAGELLLAPARTAARRFIVPGVGDNTQIRISRYGAEAGVRGAALLARERH